MIYRLFLVILISATILLSCDRPPTSERTSEETKDLATLKHEFSSPSPSSLVKELLKKLRTLQPLKELKSLR